MFIVGTAVQLAWNALQLGAPLGDDLRALQQASLRAVVYASFVIALAMPCSRAGAARGGCPIADELARRLSLSLRWIASLSALEALVAELNVIVGASLSAGSCARPVCAAAVADGVGQAQGHMRAAPTASDADAGAAWPGRAPAVAGLIPASRRPGRGRGRAWP